MKGKSKLVRAVGVLMAMAILAINFSPRAQLLRNLPSTIYLGEGQKQVLDFLFPLRIEVEGNAVNVGQDKSQTLADVGEGTTISSEQVGQARLQFSLLGIKLKEVKVEVTPQKVLIPGGQAVGIAMKTEGVYVVDTSAVSTAEGNVSPARDGGIFPGDHIVRINNVSITSLDQLSALVEEGGAKPLSVVIKRDDEQRTLTITPALDSNGSPRLGIWGRDSTAGVGTLTYFDPSDRKFGALGHAITDSDTGRILNVRDGAVYLSDIIGIVRGKQGQPGELRGIFSTDGDSLGRIRKNSDFGIYGLTSKQMDSFLYPGGLPIAAQNMVKEGPAQILTTLDGDGVKAYDCRIVKLSPQAYPSTRSMVIQVTDPVLLERTGGIVQGMSGSPIIQDGYIVGAVTHVYVNDPTRGYGLYIEWMLNAQDEVSEVSGRV